MRDICLTSTADDQGTVRCPDLAADTGVRIDWQGGHVPVQAEGCVDGQDLYFRSRGSRWEVWIGPAGHHFTTHPSVWSYSKPYGTWPDAGYITDEQALAFISEAVAAYRARSH